MKRLFSILVALALSVSLVAAIVPASPVMAATPIYVNGTTGSDANPGTTPATAKKTIQAGINVVDVGGTVIVAAGTYQENLASWKDMEITKSLSLIGAGSGVTVIELSEGDGLGGKMNGLEIRGSNLDITIQGITFTRRSGNTYATSYPLRIAETTSTFTKLTLIDVEVAYAEAPNVILGKNGIFQDVVVEDCHFHHAGTWGFLGSGTINKITVKDSDFDYNGQVNKGHGNGFDLTGPASTNVLVEGGSFSYNTQAGINLMRVSGAIFRGVVANYNSGNPGGGFGIKLDEWGGKSQNILFEDCTATGNALDGITITPEKDDAIEDVRIVGATLSDNGRNGLNLCYIYSGSNNPEMCDVSISCSTITGNGNYGVQVWSWWVAMTITEVFDAIHNWWGDDSGPYHATLNPSGTGDAVSDNVDFDPWVGTESVATTTGTGTASFATSNGEIVGLAAVPVPPLPPAGVMFPHGMFSFTICCLTPGETVTLTITLPSAVPVGTKWWKYQSGAWYSLPIGSDDGDNTITITLADGGTGDEDTVAGQITDPGGPGNPGPVGWETYPINKVGVFLPWIVLLAAIMAGAGLLVLRRRRTQT